LRGKDLNLRPLGYEDNLTFARVAFFNRLRGWYCLILSHFWPLPDTKLDTNRTPKHSPEWRSIPPPLQSLPLAVPIEVEVVARIVIYPKL